MSGFAYVGGVICVPVWWVGHRDVGQEEDVVYVHGKKSKKEQWVWERIKNGGQRCFKKEKAL